MTNKKINYIRLNTANVCSKIDITEMQFVSIVCLITVLTASIAQQVQQCICSKFEPCEAKYEKALKPCIEACTDALHIDQQGVNVTAVKDCVQQDEQMINSAFSCFRADHKNACAHGKPKMVEKRFPETLRLAVMNELHNMVDSGAMNKVGPLIAMAKRMSTCVQKCMDKAADGCYKKMESVHLNCLNSLFRCGLDLAPDTQLIQEAKECASKSGLNTAGLQQLCQCISKSGITSLQGVCGKIHT